ncbi:MAG: AAA family ATPase [Rhodocyclaceae bacterium]|nr:AAA family ATPase [Rhodocyclaceae bacterium]
MNKYITLNRDALVRLRQAKALSQEGLSWACQERGLPLSAATIKRAEAGRAILYRSARCFADYFDCPLGELTVDKPAAALGSLVAQVSAANPAAAATLLGRDFELQVFTQTLLRCEDENKGRLLCIRGVAGIGKSSLLSTFCGIGRDAGCPTYMVSLEQRQGHKNSFVRLLEQLFPSTATTSPEALYAHICDCMSLGSRERIHLALLLDVAPPSSAGTKPSARISSDGHVQVLIDIIRARHPGAAVVVMFEDIHWAAQDLLMNLKALSAGIHEVPVLMVLSTRPENDPIDTIWRSGLFNTPMHTLDLAPLSKTAARAVALAHADMDADYLEKILRQADGNPLFLQQLLLDYPDRIGRLPRTIQELVKSRLAGLDTASVKLASAAAVIGDQVDLDLLRHLLDTDHLDFDGLLQSQIVRSRDQSSMRFTHALICQGIYENTGDELKRELHGRAAKWFYGRDKRLHAQHLGLADSLQASRAFLVAAEEALGKHNFGAALSLIDSALLKPASPQEAFQFLLIKGLIFNKLDLPEKALSWFAQALALADSGDDRCEIHLAMAATYILLQRWKDATAQLDIAEPLCHGELNTRCHFLKATARNIRSRLHCLSGLLLAGAFHVQNGVKQCH